MTGAQKRKGDRAELEAAQLVSDLLGVDCRRLLGAGRHDDRGDLDVPGRAIQVANWDNGRIASALRVKTLDADIQAARSGTFGVAMLRLRGGDFRMGMTPDTWARIHRHLATAYRDGYAYGYTDHNQGNPYNDTPETLP